MSEQKSPFRPLKPLPNLIFMSRWFQVPLYLGLIVAQGVYVWQFGVELTHLLDGLFSPKGPKMTETDIMLLVLGLIDVVMISNLLVMVIVGGYETFVSRMHLEGHPDQPEWLSHVNAAVLKVKLATAIIGISSIHLLKSFINADKLTHHTLLWQTVIHLAFIVSALSIAWIDRIMDGGKPHAKHARDDF
ncbi:MAG: TIGR00645 family protein [Betaproteobacteria bacterium]|nr:TIGR00645 family protein [Betaproteobacteria bacterium]